MKKYYAYKMRKSYARCYYGNTGHETCRQRGENSRNYREATKWIAASKKPEDEEGMYIYRTFWAENIKSARILCSVIFNSHNPEYMVASKI